MRIPKQLLGKMVVLHWLDPTSRTEEIKTRDASDLPRGEKGLTKRIERGLLDDLTDGVVRIRHWESLGEWNNEPDEIYATWVQEDLIRDLVVYEPVPPRPVGTTDPSATG